MNIDEMYIKEKPTMYINQEEPKSQGIIGNITVHFTKTFNWLQRKMWKVCFGVEIKNLK